MIIGEALGAWLNDRKAQLETYANVEKVAKRLRQLPALERLQDGLQEARRDGADGVLRLAESFMETPGLVPEMLAPLIAAATADPYFSPPFKLALSEVHSGFLLFDRPELTLTFAVMSADAIAAKRAERRGGASLLFTGRRSILHFIKGSGAILSFWEAPPVEPGFTSGTSGRCQFVERRRIGDGERLELDGRRFTFIVEEASHDIVFMQAMTLFGAAPLTVEYDSQTLRFIGASSTDEASSRTQMMLALLRVMDRRDAVPVFRDLLGSEHFYARWQTMREFLALDAGAALPHLRAMAAADPHSEVRQAAAQTLTHFFPEDSRREEEPA